MRPVLAPAFLCALMFLLPLTACGWAPTVATPFWSKTNEIVHLFTFRLKRKFHLQIYPNGNVNGAPQQTVESAVILKVDCKGYLKIIGVKSGLFLCMHRNGKLYGSNSFSNEDCVFKHHRLENNYNAYESTRHNLLVSLGRYKGPLVPNKKLPHFSQFLVRKNEIPLSKLNSQR